MFIRFYYETENVLAMIFGLVAVVFCLLNCLFCLPCWVGFGIVALKQRSFCVDFNDKEGRVDVKEVGALRKNIILERSFPYSQISKAITHGTNVTINNEPALAVALELTDSTIVDVSTAEVQSVAEIRCRVLNQHLSDAKNNPQAAQEMV
jgi:hypothetical protein